MKLCLASSSGGHLTELLQLEKVFKNRRHFFLTFEREDSRELSKKEKVYFIVDPKRNPLKLIKNFTQSLSILIKERPDVIITTGAGVVVPICYLSKLFGSKIIYLESFCRVDDPSLTGRFLYPIANLFLVQWEDLLKKYGPKARFWGGVV